MFDFRGSHRFRQLFVLAVLIAFLHPPAMFSQSKPLEPKLINLLKEKVKDASETTQSITSDFSQLKEMSMISEKINSKGTFYFKKERLLRWEYTEPFSYIIVIRNDQISIKDENDVSHFNMASSKIFLEVNRIIIGSIQGTLLQDEKNFKTSYFDTPAAYLVKLYPKASKLKESLAEIDIYFSHKDFTVDKLEMIESGGDKTRISFQNKMFNKTVADEKFTLH